jgi:urate oxidase
MPAILVEDNYGKSRVRLVKVARHGDRHDLQEIEVKIAFEGDFETAHTLGDNSRILPTDTMKNTVYALAKQLSEIEEIETFALRLADHFLQQNRQTSRVIIEVAERQWERISVGGKAHDHAFIKTGDEVRTVRIAARRDEVMLESGIKDLLILKTTGSGFSGFIKDRYTTLKETDDRIFATAVKATWQYSDRQAPYKSIWRGVRRMILETFAEHDSLSVQQTLYAIGEAVLHTYDEIAEISLSLPNKHCLLVDLSPFEMENEYQIFLPIDEPHGLIEARMKRAPDGGDQ